MFKGIGLAETAAATACPALHALMAAAADDDARSDVLKAQVRAARRYSLIEWSESSGAVSMHRLVQDVQRRQLARVAESWA